LDLFFLTDIIMPSSHLPVAVIDSLPQVSVDNCLLAVLSWNPNWLNEYGMSHFYAFTFCFHLFDLLKTWQVFLVIIQY